VSATSQQSSSCASRTTISGYNEGSNSIAWLAEQIPENEVRMKKGQGQWPHDSKVRSPNQYDQNSSDKVDLVIALCIM
jgi:hypothetical protein